MFYPLAKILKKPQEEEGQPSAPLYVRGLTWQCLFLSKQVKEKCSMKFFIEKKATLN